MTHRVTVRDEQGYWVGDLLSLDRFGFGVCLNYKWGFVCVDRLVVLCFASGLLVQYLRPIEVVVGGFVFLGLLDVCWGGCCHFIEWGGFFLGLGFEFCVCDVCCGGFRFMVGLGVFGPLRYASVLVGGVGPS